MVLLLLLLLLLLLSAAAAFVHASKSKDGFGMTTAELWPPTFSFSAASYVTGTAAQPQPTPRPHPCVLTVSSPPRPSTALPRAPASVARCTYGVASYACSG